MLGFLLPGKGLAMPGDTGVAFQPNAYLKIDQSGKITIFVSRQEIGQGVNTSLAMVVADELDADWKNVSVEIMPYSVAPIPNSKEGGSGIYDTGGSQSVMGDFAGLRNAGATAKMLLIAAAAQQWKVQPTQCRAENGFVINTVTKAKLSYAQLAPAAATLPLPKEVVLKSAKDLRLVGRPVKRSNLKDIITGRAKYGIDVKVPGMVYASVERCPVLDGKLVSVDDTACKQVTGFIKTVPFESTGVPMHVHAGVAVIATTIWGAMKARKLLNIVWDEGAHNKDSTEELFKTFAAKANDKPLREVYKKGDVANTATNTLEATYAEPFLAHGTIEPINFVASVKPGYCELWGGLQLPDWTVQTIAGEVGLKPEEIKVNLTLSGGGFGRRLHFDFAIEAVRIAKQLNTPVKVIWDRTDDIRNDTYRPASHHSLKASWDNTGKLQTWQHHKLETAVQVMVEGPDTKSPPDMLGGANSDLWYDIPNVYTGYTNVDFNLNRGWVRAVELCVNVFPVESFIDEIARKQGKDPLQFRLGMLEGRAAFETEGSKLHLNPQRVANALKLAAEKIGYNTPRKSNHYIGVATHFFSFAKAYAAHAIEIELLGAKKFKIIKIVSTVDCGMVINPDGLKNQMEGGTVFALSQVLMSEITVTNSRVDQDGFYTYQVCRMPDVPPIEVYTIPSTEEPGGIGETALPTLAPALCNALAAAGQGVRSLPLGKDGWEWG